MAKNLNVFLCALIFATTAFSFSTAARRPEEARGLPLQFTTAPPTQPIAELPPTFTQELARDWALPRLTSVHPLVGKPDHSLRTVWVRMFPLATVPLSDPYPKTVDINVVDLECKAGLAIYNLTTQTFLGKTSSLHLDFSKPTFKIGSVTVNLQTLWIIAAGPTTTLRWDTGKLTAAGKKADVGVKLRGQFAVKQTMFESNDVGKPHPLGQQLWSVINLVDINNYIESVVPSEIISTWDPETIKAQAIAARTYGMFEVAEARSVGADWDIDPSTWFQSYRGVEFYDRNAKSWQKVELSSTSQAVTDTHGEVITYNGAIIKAYFSANSGGPTCTASECFDVPDQPYLAQVQDASDIKTLPGGTWGSKATLTPDNIKAKMAEGGVTTAQTVTKVEALSRGPSGRTWTLRVHLASGSVINLDKLQTRKIMHLYGPLRSFLYTLGKMTGGKQEILGHGFGHGVGLSQWGAQSFAKQGWSAHKILQHYYRNVKIEKL